VKLLTAAKIVDGNIPIKWTRASMLVVTGHDRQRPRPVDVLHLLMHLQAEASKSGGE